MISIFLAIAMIMYPASMMLFDFNDGTNLKSWTVVDDGVMGGLSKGNLSIGSEGHAVFYGDVSLENNGGFSSIRHRFSETDIADYSKISIRLRGDGKRYQFRVKANRYDRHSYIYYFSTTGSWQTVEIPLQEMNPSFRGRYLDMPNFQGDILEEIAFLIANNEAESFKLQIDRIQLQ